MIAVRELLEELGGTRRSADDRGLWVGAATGLLVSMGVLRVFLAIRVEPAALWWVLFPVGVALWCTSATAIAAVRADRVGKAVAWTFAGNVLPPTLLCAPTIIGVIYATPAGLVAFALALPLVLAGRWAIRDDHPASGARERLVAAAGLVVATGLLGAAHAVWPGRTAEQIVTQALPPALTGLAALGLAASAMVTEGRRAVAARALRRGELEGWAAGAPDGDVYPVARVARVGAGPMRLAETRQAVGTLVASAGRATAGVLLTGLSAVALLATGLVYAVS